MIGQAEGQSKSPTSVGWEELMLLKRVYIAGKEDESISRVEKNRHRT